MYYNPEIHHRRSIRIQGYDYSGPGKYFITICVKERSCLFGRVVKGKMELNDAGKIANECWMNIPDHFPNVTLHEYIVMPNHIHGIIELTRVAGVQMVGVQNFEPLPLNPGESMVVGAQNFVPLPPGETQQPGEPWRNSFQKIIPGSIGSIIRGYKTGVTKWFHANTNIQTVWQRNYYEHIIRDEQSGQTIAGYIINNPLNWDDDKFFVQ